MILFIGGVGDLFFFYEIFPSRGFSLANFIIFLVLIFVPYTKFIKCNFIGEKGKSGYYPKSLSDIYFKFYNDYQRQNPFTKKLGLTNYLTALKDKGYLSKNAFDTAMENIDKLNLMEIYYGIRRGNIPQIHQSIMANTNNKSISGNNINIRQSLANPNINDDEEEKKRKQNYLDAQINIIFGNINLIKDNETIKEETYNFPLATIDEEGETKDILINAYNNPLAINMGLGVLPMYNNIYKGFPIFLSKRVNSNNYENEINNIQNKDSQEINVKINNDIENHRKEAVNKKTELNNNANDMTDYSLTIQKGKDEHIDDNFYLLKKESNSERNAININIINQSQNEKVNNSLLNKKSINSLNKEKNQEQENEQEQKDVYISSNINFQKMDEIPMDEIPSINNEDKIDFNLLKYNISDLRISKINNNEKVNSDNKNKIPNLDNDKIDINLSKSQK